MAAETLLNRQYQAVRDAQDHPRRLGDVDDVAGILKCSAKTVRRQADLRRLPGVVRIGRLLRFDLNLISRWLDQGAPPLSRFDKDQPI